MRFLIFERGEGDATRRRVVEIYGSGLLGAAIQLELQAARATAGISIPVPWRDADGRAGAWYRIAGQRERLLTQGATRVDLVFAAGAAGFECTEAAAADEEAAFHELLRDFSAAARRSPQTAHVIHLISSAGGLFEGQILVDTATQPAPRRPYGFLKLRQERLLEELPPGIGYRIYRPSSAYGPVRPGFRQGLVSRMIANGVRHRLTHINGAPGTLRDYVASENIGAWIAKRVMEEDCGDRARVEMLVQGRSAALLEIKQIVESILRKRIYVTYSPDPDNDRDISFNPSCRPYGFVACDVRIGIARLLQTWTSVREGA